MERTLAEFIAYLHTTKNTSANTEISYQRDLRKLIRYLQEQDICDFVEVTSLDLKAYLSIFLKREESKRLLPRILSRLR